MALLNTLSFIWRHPLNAHGKMAALGRFARWQIASRLIPESVVVPFVSGTRLLIKRGMTGATGNYYCGLHEFEDMAVVLHGLRQGDLFVDVGANVGSYTILAAGACGASVVAVEPIPSTFQHLLDNIRLNHLETLVSARNIALGSAPGELLFSGDFDTMNHVLSTNERSGNRALAVRVETMDGILGEIAPTMIKIDVEGYEASVLRGATKTLDSEGLLAILVELNGSGDRYGFDEAALHQDIIKRGYLPHRYEPFVRRLVPLASKNRQSGNTLYVRSFDVLAARLKTADKRNINGLTV